MTQFYFGTHQRRLFGVYDPSLWTGRAARAAVLCHPLGNEQIFAYRTLRQLAARMAQEGFHILRFDYYGTGDSYGDTGAGDFLGWCKDIETAITELQDMTAVERVSLVGLRFGANLAAQVAAMRPEVIDKLVLWDPLLVDALDTDGLGFAAPCSLRSFKNSSGAGRHFAPVDVSGPMENLPPSTLVLLTAPSTRAVQFRNLAVEHIASASPWIEERIETGTIPTEAVQRIVNWLA